MGVMMRVGMQARVGEGESDSEGGDGTRGGDEDECDSEDKDEGKGEGEGASEDERRRWRSWRPGCGGTRLEGLTVEAILRLISLTPTLPLLAPSPRSPPP